MDAAGCGGAVWTPVQTNAMPPRCQALQAMKGMPQAVNAARGRSSETA